MSYFVISIIMSTIFYTVALYVSYISSFMLYQGIKYRLISPVIKASAFILICYTSIIADILLYAGSQYDRVFYKNGLLMLLIVVSLLHAKKWKGE